ncbi:Cytochrome C biogenesis transmembrane region family protein [uncultured Stenotrophomonas sp.]|uniref:Cytochrome C biogenesis transmembrane region family protein n=1 Tax=uncultured Stenotrophomonas sp. TaxID=165438 RepID=A0A1Y5Q3M8_9GAMM|nr:Cytochrome C biogenesis transmembrane region family protein [uncultured Stenotrophomonas sp.]
MKRLLQHFTALLLLAGCALPAWAISEKDLLPVDQAFALRAEAISRDRIELHWDIAPGYYLYRHRTSVKAGPGFDAGALRMPDGEKKHDEFFGDVETYHRQLQATLPGSAAPGIDTVTLEVRYQGCADAGVCYPPQKRTLEVKLPADTAGITPANPLARASGGGLKLPGVAASQNLPLPSEQAFGFEAIVDDGNRLLLRFSPAPGYYLYRDRTSLALEGAAGIRTGQPQWPAGTSHRDEHFGDVVVYFDQVDVPLPLRREHAKPADITLVTTFQGCQTDGICYPPMTRRVRLSLPAGKVSHSDEAIVVPRVIPPLPSGGRGATLPPADDLPAPQPLVMHAGPAPAATVPDASADNDRRSLPPATAGRTDSLPWILLLALAGGLILNLMPCVLPVLSLKVLGLAQSGESRRHARRHALWYTLGVLVAFAAVGALVLALRAAGQAAGWGFQLQHPWFIAALAYLMFVVGLSLSGVFTLGGTLGGAGQSLVQRQDAAGDFFTGVLACVVASPCIAPFMGPALAYAFTAPATVAMLVFLMLGLGLALPFLLIGFVPALARRLPKPGAWMETFKQLLAFPMYLTAIWLLWVLGKQRGIDATVLLLAGMAVLALGLWWFERSRWHSRRFGMALGAAIVLLALAPVWGVARMQPPARAASEGTVAYSPEMLDRLRADNRVVLDERYIPPWLGLGVVRVIERRADNRVVFVNMTADWCVTCKANERNVLDRAAFRDGLKRVDAVYMRGDWTNVDPQISAFLEQHKAVGVPLYVVYGPGAPPRVLPTVLTQSVVEDALLRAAR